MTLKQIIDNSSTKLYAGSKEINMIAWEQFQLNRQMEILS